MGALLAPHPRGVVPVVPTPKGWVRCWRQPQPWEGRVGLTRVGASIQDHVHSSPATASGPGSRLRSNRPHNAAWPARAPPILLPVAGRTMDAKVSQNDLKELRRVFDFLADFAPKNKLRRELQPKLERRAKIAMFLRNPEAVKMVDETGAELPMAVVTLEDKRLEDECRELAARVDAVAAKGDDVKRIHPRDLFTALEFLGKPTNKKEVEDMLWEVDEDIDGSVCWTEFQLMFRRNIADKTGLEPCQLFSVVQFLMYDREFTGMVSLDQTMHMLYNRYGKDRLEVEMKVRAAALRPQGATCATLPSHASLPRPPPPHTLFIHHAGTFWRGRGWRWECQAVLFGLPQGRQGPQPARGRSGGAGAGGKIQRRPGRKKKVAHTLKQGFCMPPLARSLGSEIVPVNLRAKGKEKVMGCREGVSVWRPVQGRSTGAQQRQPHARASTAPRPAPPSTSSCSTSWAPSSCTTQCRERGPCS